tara:strand:- start:95 stop:928 length:834 start_codon:yes stop_codon:yes gene_type:complete
MASEPSAVETGDAAGVARPRVHMLLDIDGTLAMTDHLYMLTFRDLMRPYGHTEVDDAWFAKHVAGKVDDAVFRALLPAEMDTPEQLAEMSRQKDETYCRLMVEQGAEVVKGLGGALEMARENGFRCVAVSNAQRAGCEAVLAMLRRELGEVTSVIEDLVVGAECARAKPHPDPYLEAMSRLGVAPSECVVFEDSRTGVRAGIAAKVAAVVGLRTSLTEEQFSEAGATRSIADWAELDAQTLRGLVSRASPPPAVASGPAYGDGLRAAGRQATYVSSA